MTARRILLAILLLALASADAFVTFSPQLRLCSIRPRKAKANALVMSLDNNDEFRFRHRAGRTRTSKRDM
jgi:hypothetical protein